jgi:hypothetical protein
VATAVKVWRLKISFAASGHGPKLKALIGSPMSTQARKTDISGITVDF